MPRGQAADVGTERVSPNGYRYIRREEGWRLVHREIAETQLGRSLRTDEYVTFVDGDKTNLSPENVIVQLRGRTSLRRKHAQICARISELEAIRDSLEERIRIQDTKL